VKHNKLGAQTLFSVVCHSYKSVMWSETSFIWHDRSQTNKNWSWSCRLRSWS